VRIILADNAVFVCTLDNAKCIKFYMQMLNFDFLYNRNITL